DGAGPSRQREAAHQRHLHRHPLPLPAGSERAERREMNRQGLAFICAALLAAACGSPPPPPRRTAPAASAAAPKPVTDDEVKPLVPSNIYVYSPIGKRDPFQNQAVLRQGFGRAAQNPGRVKTRLEKWSL